jgi:hypothetical protein
MSKPKEQVLSLWPMPQWPGIRDEDLVFWAKHLWYRMKIGEITGEQMHKNLQMAREEQKRRNDEQRKRAAALGG